MLFAAIKNLYKKVMKTPCEIIDFIGQEKMAIDLNVRRERIVRARRSEKLPAMWFNYCEQIIQKNLPRELFTFK